MTSLRFSLLTYFTDNTNKNKQPSQFSSVTWFCQNIWCRQCQDREYLEGEAVDCGYFKFRSIGDETHAEVKCLAVYTIEPILVFYKYYGFRLCSSK